MSEIFSYLGKKWETANFLSFWTKSSIFLLLFCYLFLFYYCEVRLWNCFTDFSLCLPPISSCEWIKGKDGTSELSTNREILISAGVKPDFDKRTRFDSYLVLLFSKARGKSLLRAKVARTFMSEKKITKK